MVGKLDAIRSALGVELAARDGVRITPPVDYRAVLKTAIEAARVAEQEAVKARNAVERAQSMLASASDRHERAQGEVTKAKATQTERMVSAASSGADIKPDMTLRDARNRELDAGDDVETAKAALATIEEAADEPLREARLAAKRVEQAAGAVLLAAMPHIKAGIIEAERQPLRLASALGFVVGFFDPYSSDNNERVSAQNFVSRHNMGRDIPDSEELRQDAVKPWQDAFEALKLDADAPMPEIG